MLLRRGLIAAVVLACAFAAASASDAAAPAGPVPPTVLRTGIFDPEAFASTDAPVALDRTRAAGATVVRLIVSWKYVERTQPTSAAQAEDPSFSGFKWAPVDSQVLGAVHRGLTPILDVFTAPDWAYSGTPSVPDPTAIAQFTTALAKRYDGSTGGLPRVKNFMFWNEPNLPEYFSPVTAAVSWYRDALNAFTAAVHAVHPDNISVAGALAPFGHGDTGPDRAPMNFISDLLCVSVGATPKPTCDTKVSADAWSFHPYTEGGPTHKARFADDLSLGDIPRAEAAILAAQKAGHLISHGPLQWWVTEFSWDTSPPDPKGVPMAIEARWTSEVLYRMWADGISVVTWFLLADEPYPSQDFQSGLYFNAATVAQEKPKLSLTAFRFPFVAIQEKGGYTLWGRTPSNRGGNVTIELKAGAKWSKVMTLRAGSGGIFHKTWTSPLKAGFVRAHVGKDISLPFSLKPVPDRAARPFGST